jgi:hypothetical protein
VSLESLLTLVVGILKDREIPYMLTGSLAGSYHGAPRSTRDIDLVVDGSREAFESLAGPLRDAGLYVSEEAIQEAVSSRGMFNAIDPETGWKVDFIVRKDRPFSVHEFENRQETNYLGLALSVARAEDVVLAKLEWAKLGDSERQLRDVAEIVSVQGDELDLDEVAEWVERLSLMPQWEKAKALSWRPGESV